MEMLLYNRKLYNTIYELIKANKMSKHKAYYLLQIEAIKRVEINSEFDEYFFTLP